MTLLRGLFCITALLGWVSNISATDYYVSERSGSDSNSGLSADAPWKSIARVNHAAFGPGDRVLLHAGEVWREQLRPPSSGTADQAILFSSYGVGARPILEGTHGAAVERRSFDAIPGRGQRTDSVDVAIDNNEQSHIVYSGLELRHVVEGLRIYAWSAALRDITLEDCSILVEDVPTARVVSAAIYANVKSGSITELRILANHLVAYPHQLEHWGVYLAGGVQQFKIRDNILGPAGEDGITIWHCAFGEISHNQGGGNGENTIDVKDAHDVAILDNTADLDQEYNMVVHSVDAPNSTYNVRVEGNRCQRGGQGGELSAGIALLFVQKSGMEDNLVEFAYGAGILIKDGGAHAGNWASRNRLIGNGAGQKLPAILLQGTSSARIEANQVELKPSLIQ